MLTTWTAFRPHSNMIDRVFADMDQIFRDLDRAAASRPSRLDIQVEEDDAGWRLSALVPGFGPDDISVTVTDNQLELHGKREAKVPEGYTAVRRERTGQEFKRTLSLGDEVDVDQITATVKRGVLDIRLPRLPTRKPHTVEVKVG